jgi:hypothetical protein
MKTKKCIDCGNIRSIGYFNKRKTGDGRQDRCSKCPAPASQKNRNRWSDDPISDHGADPDTRAAQQRRHWKYGLKHQDYTALWADQGGRCAICGDPDPGFETLFVDHDHSCCPGQKTCGGCVRGLLCIHCNSALGRFKDSTKNLESAIRYLKGCK